MIGYACNQVGGLPAFVYGAGLNLFDVEIAAFFMNRLGAYRVDRRKKNPIYLECLTTMASLSLHKGVNNIFFPGGTRSRSGAMEEKLKLGLLGSVIDAQREIIFNKDDNKIFIVPVTLGYHFVFEAKSLVEQHLKAAGREKYSRSKENVPGGFSFKFFKKFFTAESEFYLSFGEPMDVLGNLVDKDGNSIDKHNRPVDLKDYFKIDGDLNENAQRESVYARHLGSKVLESYFKHNLILPSHLVAYVAFKCFELTHPDEDLFSLLRKTSRDFNLDEKVFKQVLQELLLALNELAKENKIRLHPILSQSYDDIAQEGMKYLGAYHSQTVLYLNKGVYKTQNLRLLYFYSNRLDGYSFEKHIESIKINS
jgi:glycerol-3-phosphate O-acyltransferase